VEGPPLCKIVAKFLKSLSKTPFGGGDVGFSHSRDNSVNRE